MSTSMDQIVRLSPLTDARFGVHSANAVGITPTNLPEVLQFCEHNKIEFLIARCPVENLELVHQLETQGFLLMDTLVYYSRSLENPELPTFPQNPPVNLAKIEEREAIKQIAQAAFKDYIGHFHADPRLDRTACDAVYPDWAERSLLEQNQDSAVLVASIEDHPVGFLTLRKNSQFETEGPLFAVAPDAQSGGIGTALMIHALHWSKKKGAQRMIISTQINNLGSQKVWGRLGFQLAYAFYTFHKWF